MNQLTLAAQMIKEIISAQDVGRALGLEIRHGRCQCPIHGGQNYNCVLYPGNRGFYCHTCKAGGDCISLVQHYYDTSFKNAVIWLNEAFHLNLNIDSPLPPDALEAAKKRQREHEAREAFRKWQEDIKFNNALAAYELVRRLEIQRDENTPKTPDESWTPPFCQAVELLPVAKQMAEDAWYDCIKSKPAP